MINNQVDSWQELRKNKMRLKSQKTKEKKEILFLLKNYAESQKNITKFKNKKSKEYLEALIGVISNKTTILFKISNNYIETHQELSLLILEVNSGLMKAVQDKDLINDSEIIILLEESNNKILIILNSIKNNLLEEKDKNELANILEKL